MLLALLVLLPLLGPGYVLHLDMVFVPTQTLLPWNLGIGAGLPRAVPQDAVVSLLAGPLPGQILQKVMLLASLILAGWGAGRLAGPGLTRQVPAASIYMWSAYTAGRLLMGHWSLLWAMALLPWVVLAARRARTRGDWLPVVLLCGLSALVPTGGVIAAAVGIPLAVGFGTVLSWPRRFAVVSLVVLINAPWWLAAMRSGSATVSDPMGLQVFGARSDGAGGILLSVIGGGGVWNSQATLGSRTTWFAALAAVVVLALAAAGWSRWLRQSYAETVVLSVLGALGLGWAWLSGVAGSSGWMQQIVSEAPGGGLLRDGQKWTVWWMLLLAVTAPWGVSRVCAHLQASLRVFMAAALALLPLATTPDLAMGAFGRLSRATYPSSWEAVRQSLAQSPEAGDVVSLPWAPYRRYAWNHADTVLDPLPRYLTRTVVWNDSLPVSVDGRVVQVGGDDPRARIIGDTITAGQPLPATLAALGIRWIVVQRDQPVTHAPANLAGADKVFSHGDLELWRVQGPIVAVSASDPLLVVVNAVALAVMLVGTLVWVGQRIRSSPKAREAARHGHVGKVRSGR